MGSSDDRFTNHHYKLPLFHEKNKQTKKQQKNRHPSNDQTLYGHDSICDRYLFPEQILLWHVIAYI